MEVVDAVKNPKETFNKISDTLDAVKESLQDEANYQKLLWLQYNDAPNYYQAGKVTGEYVLPAVATEGGSLAASKGISAGGKLLNEGVQATADALTPRPALVTGAIGSDGATAMAGVPNGATTATGSGAVAGATLSVGSTKNDIPLTNENARQIIDPNSDEAWLGGTDKIYARIRNNTSDIQNISNNTGFSEADITRIKQHVFENDHTFVDGNNTVRIGKFDPDPEIANAWNRLEKGDYTQKDIDLLNHELRESRVEGMFKTTYKDAHNATEKKGWTWNP